MSLATCKKCDNPGECALLERCFDAEERACAAEAAWEARRDDEMIAALERAEK